ncbi:MAG: hypothetical protein WD740_02885 [Anaerolineales bacterium]
MLFRQPFLEGLQAGKLSTAFRRWHRPRVKAGTKLRTEIGVVEVGSVEPILELEITNRDAELAGYLTKQALLAELSNFQQGQLYRIQVRYAGEDPRIELRNDADLSAEEFQRIQRKLQGYERSGTWTQQVLKLIAAQEAILARKLAAQVGMDTPAFKRRARQLKELGLTESLDVGYRLSPRGKAYLNILAEQV